MLLLLKHFFLWCFLINAGILVLSTLGLLFFRQPCIRLHQYLFKLPEERMVSAMYKFLGIYKVLVIIFNLVPYLALQLL